MAVRYASMNPDDAESGGFFQGGRTKVKTLRFGRGYSEGKSDNIITLQLVHVPKGDSEPRTEYFSCGAKASGSWKPSKDGKHLVAKEGGASKSINENCNAMMFMDSLTKGGFPQKKLNAGDMSLVDDWTLDLRTKPIKREGLVIEGDDNKPKTVLLVVKAWPKGETPSAPYGDEDDEPAPARKAKKDVDEDTEEADDDDEAEDKEDEDEDEAEAEDESEDDEKKEKGGGDDEDEAEDAEADEDAPDDALVLKHLKAVVKAAGGSIKRTKLGAAAFKALRKEAQRNAICSRMVEEALLSSKAAKKAGIEYSVKSGTIEA